MRSVLSIFALVLLAASSLSHAMKPEATFLLQFENSNEVILIGVGYRTGYGAFKGVPGELKALEIVDYDVLRDGGTTLIALKDGSGIFIPASSKNDARASFTAADGTVFPLESLAPTTENLAAKLINVEAPLKPLAVVSAKEFTPAQTPVLEPGPVEIEQAFADPAGNRIVRFKYGPEVFGTNLTFWGPRGENRLYQINETFLGGSYSESSGREYSLSFAAPTASHPERKATISVERNGPLTLKCENGSACFLPLSRFDQGILEMSVNYGGVRLEGLPATKRVEYLFKVHGQDTYILVDSPEFNFSYDFDVYIGEAGSLKKVGVKSVRRLRDGGTTQIFLNDGRIIYSPTPFKTGEAARLMNGPTDFDGVKLERLKNTATKAASLGADLRRYEAGILRTPLTGDRQCTLSLSGQ